MAVNINEEEQLRSIALQNATSILHVRQRAEDSLRKQSEWLRITLSSIGDAVISTDAVGLITFMNGVAETLTGWSQAEALGHPLHEIFHIINERTRLPSENPALQALRHGTIVRLASHAILIARDGTERPIDDSAAPIRDNTGAAIGSVIVFRDVSERKYAAEAQARLAAIVETSEDAIVSKTLDGIIQSWNAGAERLFGYSAQEAIGQPITLVIPPDRRDEERHIMERLRRGERIEHFETVRVGKDGRFLNISLTVSPLFDSDGRVIGASKVARDISDRIRTQEMLAQITVDSEKRRRLYETIMASTPDLIYVFGLDHRFTYANAALLKLWGRSWDDAIGKNCLELGYPDWHAAMHDREINQVIATKQSIRGEVAFKGTKGTRIYDYIFVPVLGANDEVEAVAGTTRDVTDRKKAEEELIAADRRKDEFIALLAHELRNPLAPIRNGLQVMRLAVDDSTITQARSMMDRQLSLMVRLIDDLLDISRISRNKMELRRERVQLVNVVNSAVETARPAIEAAGHQLTLSLPQEPIYLDADLTRLAQVFSNLLTNSAKYTENGGRISLEAERSGEDLVVTVCDTGIGIPANALPHIFDMFSQVDRSVERATGGLGIGLALVKGLVEMHGGTVTARSEGPGKGSSFRVKLPALINYTDNLEKTSTEVVENYSRPKRRILVVDDNKDSATSLALMLELLHNEVRIAHDGLEAVEAAEGFRPQVILMDVGMPKLNGLDATRRIRQQSWGQSVIIIALTGWGQDDDKLRSQQAGCNGHLVKPAGLADLQKLLSGQEESA